MYDYNKRIQILDNYANSIDSRDQKFLDIQQAKLGIRPIEPLLRERMGQIDCRNQEWQDIHQMLNTPNFNHICSLAPLSLLTSTQPVLTTSAFETCLVAHELQLPGSHKW